MNTGELKLKELVLQTPCNRTLPQLSLERLNQDASHYAVVLKPAASTAAPLAEHPARTKVIYARGKTRSTRFISDIKSERNRLYAPSHQQHPSKLQDGRPR